MTFVIKVANFGAGVRHLQYVAKARQALLGLHHKRTELWLHDLQIFQRAKADYEHCQQLLEENKLVELVEAFGALGIKVKPRTRKAKQQHRKAAA